MSYLTTNDGTRLYYRDYGTGKPIVFVHAWAMTSGFWDYVIPHFVQQGYRAISFDRRGHGKSDDPGRGYDYATFTDDLHSLMVQLDLHDVTLIGHSMGGAEVMRYQTRYGKEGIVSRLVLVAAPERVKKAADNPEGIDGAMLNKMLDNISADYPQWLADNAYPFFPTASEGMVRWTIEMMLQVSSRYVCLECQRLVYFSDFRPDATGIDVPTLIIHGDADASIPIRCGYALARLIPDNIFKVYEGAPHGLLVTHTERLNKDILAFIKDSIGMPLENTLSNA